MVTVRKAIQVNGSNWAAVGSVLAQAVGDAVNLSTSYADVNFYFQQPLVLPPGHSYFFTLEWTNSTDTSNYVVAKYDTVVTTNPVYTNDQTVNKDGWTETAAELQLQIWDFGAEGTVTGTAVGDYYVYTQRLDNLMSGTNPYQFDGVEFKIGLEAIAGTPYNASSATLENPASIIHYLLRNDVMGLNLSTSYADYDQIDDIRDEIGSNLKAAWVQESSASVAEIINEVCRQFRLRLWKTRAGKMSLNFPTPETGTYDFDLSEAAHRGDLRVLGITESPDNDLINSIDVLYSTDALAVNSDAALTRKVIDQKYLELEYIRDGETGEASNDTQRAAAATASIALYGLRAAVWRFYMHVRQEGVRKVLNYYFDRYSKQRTLLTVRIPRKTWYSTIDLFSKGRTKHSRIMGPVGSRGDEPTRITDGAGSTAIFYQDGVPITWISEGVHTGEVLKVEEAGAYMVVTVESMNSFTGTV